MDLLNIIVSITCIFIVSLATLGRVSAIRWEFKDTFEPGNVLFVKESMNVELLCSTATAKATVSSVTWSPEDKLPTDAVTLFNASHPIKKSNKYYFSTLANTFTIYNMRKQDTGIYYCSEILQRSGRSRLQYCILKLIKIPQKNPICSTNFRYTIVFHDEMKDKFEFNCSTETGNPPLEIDIFLDDVILPPDVSWTKNGLTTVSIITYMSKDWNNKTFVCSVRQELPFPYNERYKETCSFGPLHILNGFAVTISPSNAFFKEGDNVTFSCRSNVSGVEKKWKNITRGKYTVKNNGESSDLNILELKPSLSGNIGLECQGSYGSRVVTGIAHVNTERTRLFLLSICLVIFVLVFIDYRRRKSKRRRQRRHKLAKAAFGMSATTVTPKSKSNNDSNISSQSYNRSIVTQDLSCIHSGRKYYDTASQSYLYDGDGYLSPNNKSNTQDVDVYDGVNG